MNNSEKKETLLQICNILINDNKLRYYNGEIYRFNGKIYCLDYDNLKLQVLNIDNNATPKKQYDVIENLKLVLKNAQAETGLLTIDHNYIAFQNVLYNLKTGRTEEFNSDVFIINQLAIDYIEFTTSLPFIHEFLNSISSNNPKRKQAILEMIGYCMTAKTDLQLAFVLYGPEAGNGKSTLIDLMRKVIGEENVSDLSLKEMSNNRFGLVEVKGKLVNVSSEMTNEVVKDLEAFKKIVTSDVVKGEKKFIQERETFRSQAKIIMIANELPIIPKDNGFYRRLHIIPLEHVFTKEEKANFKNELHTIMTEIAIQDYLGYISLKAYEEMRNNNSDFSNYEESEVILDKYKTSNDNIMQFVKDNDNLKDYFNNKVAVTENMKAITIRHNNKSQQAIKTSSLFTLYKWYCNECNYKPYKRNTFYSTIEERLKLVTRIKNAGSDYFILNE